MQLGLFTSLDLISNFIQTFPAITEGSFRSYRGVTWHTAYIAQGAKARGLEVRDFGTGRCFYREGRLIGGTQKMVTSLVSSIAVSVCRSKEATKELLEAAGVATPAGIVLKTSELERGLSYLESATGLLVVKPSAGSAGDGVTCSVSGNDEFREAWLRASAGLLSSSIMIEEQIVGLDIRAYVVGNRVVAAATRLPAHVVGDGRHTIAELIEAKLAERAKNAYLAKFPLVVDADHLARVGHSMTTIPEHGAVALLNETANLHQGGENVDVTQSISDDLKDLAVRAARAIPGLGAAGIDLMVRSLESADGAVVLEANTSANITVHHRPAYGDAVNVGKALVDEMIRLSE
ncbi:D-alanine-D-alanine ligase-like ATP-grasp enzyme [Arthrobacter sp. V4I6]|uniref:hypothetical protein n=1 Tax=unclassified Arthrobacter TaxID=235627 RepID=UPI00278A2525|nr:MULTISPECIES: hypothetical protein [unclassified Arthrobacter]MDQ0820440.1 D-alanine-D-alanine ligase-like ATP-grasp enzyme [Arthrobacter sp. V1I7]MDQ0854621.1 D-alanine-D-alanine ligase-like ATP-grasp enzyme [Arthrobacter sp. V4I6]